MRARIRLLSLDRTPGQPKVFPQHYQRKSTCFVDGMPPEDRVEGLLSSQLKLLQSSSTSLPPIQIRVRGAHGNEISVRSHCVILSIGTEPCASYGPAVADVSLATAVSVWRFSARLTVAVPTPRVVATFSKDARSPAEAAREILVLTGRQQ